jgi:hypothetical protein
MNGGELLLKASVLPGFFRGGEDRERSCTASPPFVVGHSTEAAAEVATRLIREFEARVGEPCGAQVGTNWSPLAGISIERSVSVENRGAKMFAGKFENVAARVATALSELLRALGAMKTVCGHVD